jgi:hypothetical protein
MPTMLPEVAWVTTGGGRAVFGHFVAGRAAGLLRAGRRGSRRSRGAGGGRMVDGSEA